MKTVEITAGVNVYVNGEEQEVLERIESAGTVAKSDLTERECYLANMLVQKSIVTRKKINGKLYYRARSGKANTKTV